MLFLLCLSSFIITEEFTDTENITLLYTPTKGIPSLGPVIAITVLVAIGLSGTVITLCYKYHKGQAGSSSSGVLSL
jgi:hypothetical protein